MIDNRHRSSMLIFVFPFKFRRRVAVNLVKFMRKLQVGDAILIFIERCEGAGGIETKTMGVGFEVIKGRFSTQQFAIVVFGELLSLVGFLDATHKFIYFIC